MSFIEKNSCHRCSVPRHLSSGAFILDYKGDLFCRNCAKELNINAERPKPKDLPRHESEVVDWILGIINGGGRK